MKSRMTIAQTAAAAHSALRSEGAASTRMVDADEIEAAIRVHLTHARKARKDGAVAARSILHGGFIPGAYRYRARADRVEIEGFTASTLTVTATRADAQRRPHFNRAPHLVVRGVWPGQTQGRILASPW